MGRWSLERGGGIILKDCKKKKNCKNKLHLIPELNVNYYCINPRMYLCTFYAFTCNFNTFLGILIPVHVFLNEFFVHIYTFLMLFKMHIKRL